jgi:7-cyano-7-deazaguanine synthase in queuosine biosynthesis
MSNLEIKNTYLLGPEKLTYNIFENFPPANKVGIAFSGGMESTLLALIAFEIYGKDNVILTYSYNPFTLGLNTEQAIKNNVENGSKLLDKDVILLDMDMNNLLSDYSKTVLENLNFLKNNYNMDILLAGYTKTFFSLKEFSNVNNTQDDILKKAFSDPVKYKNTIDEFHLNSKDNYSYALTLNIPALSSSSFNLFKDERICKIQKLPFEKITKTEIVDLYIQLGLVNYMFETRTCQMKEIEKTGRHCGLCLVCQGRYSSITNMGLEDKTVYANNNVIIRHKSSK